jgi:hypothetical protein
MSRIDDDLARWPAVRARVEPLPGGVLALRRRLRDRHRASRTRWLVAAAAACTVALAALWLVIPRDRAGVRDPSALFAHEQPHPEAVQLGLAAKPRGLELSADPRVADDVVVFRWVTSGEVRAPRESIQPLDPRGAGHQLVPTRP